ncbi:hypothetical protein BH11CYA1_BH11CYA1_32660 [soil metagenome]
MSVNLHRSIVALLFLSFLVCPQADRWPSALALAASSKEQGEFGAKAHQLSEEAMAAQHAGNFSQAEPLLLEALQLSEKIFKGGHNGVAQNQLIGSIERLADCYFLQGKYSEAEGQYLRAVSLRRQSATIKDKSLIRDLNNLAALYQKNGKISAADDISGQALALVEMNWGASPELAVALSARAKILLEAYQPLDAVALFDRALAIRLKEAKGNDPNVSALLTSLAKAYLDSDNYHAAEKALKQALDIDLANSGRQSLPVVVDLSTIGQLYLRQGKYGASEHAYSEALEICTKLKGEKDPETAACMNNLAFLYSNMNEYDKGETLLRSGLEIREQFYGGEHPFVAQNLINLADLLVSSGKPEQAEPLLLRALKIETTAFGPNHDYVLLIERELVDILQNQPSKLALAETYARLVLEHDQAAAAGGSLLVARDLESLGKILIAQDKIGEAKPVIAKARSIESMQKGLYFEKQRNASNSSTAASPFTNAIQDKWALVIGISSFQDAALNLRFAAKDAVDFRNFLVNQAGFRADHVKLLTDHEATRANIVALLGDQWLKRVVKADDLAVVYISSHGTQAANQVGGANFIVPYEGNAQNIVFSGIPMQWLIAGLKDLVHSDRICVFLDVCHSGAAANGHKDATKPESSTKPSPKPSPESSPESVSEIGQASTASGGKALYRIRNIDENALASPPGQVVVAASQADQISWESKRYSNSVFTRRLIEGLALHGKDTTLEQAFTYLHDRVEEEVLRDRTQIQAPVVVPKLGAANEPQLGCKPANPRSVAEPSAVAGAANPRASLEPK